jgi:type VI secretion system secreted protein Hcp
LRRQQHWGSVSAVAERWFLKIDGIDGESTVDGHAGEIDVLSWSWGVTYPGGGPGAGSGAGAGKPEFNDFNFVARISKASPLLFLSCATGTHHKFAALTGARAGEKIKGSEFLKYKLTDVQVTGVQHAGGEAESPTEQFSLNYTKFEISFSPMKVDGSLGAAVTAKFDLKQSKKI